MADPAVPNIINPMQVLGTIRAAIREAGTNPNLLPDEELSTEKTENFNRSVTEINNAVEQFNFEY